MSAYVTTVQGPSGSMVVGDIIDPKKERLPFTYTFCDPEMLPLFDYYSRNHLLSKHLVAILKEAGIILTPYSPAMRENSLAAIETHSLVTMNDQNRRLRLAQVVISIS